MKKSSKLGVYWGQGGFFFVEVDKGQILKYSFAPLNTLTQEEQKDDIPEEIRTSAAIKSCLTENHYNSTVIELTLPAKDLIFRSFIIPAMQPEEIKNVVDFEITKYVPIKTDELSFRYQAIPFSDKGQRNLRIYLIAIRKDTLKRYKEMMDRANLQITRIEPAPISILRLLKIKKILPKNQTTAIIEIGDDGGDILIATDDVIQFVREFQISSKETMDSDLLTSKIVNDIRMSFNFYTRQNPLNQIQHILIISLHGIQNIDKSLQGEFHVPVRSIRARDIFKSEVAHDGLLKAFGVALADKSQSLDDFNLLEGSYQSSAPEESFTTVLNQIPPLVIGLSVAVVIVLLSLQLSGQNLANQRKQLAALQQNNVFQTMEPSAIEKMTDELALKVKKYRSIRSSSDISTFLHKIPALMPAGLWLKSFSVRYEDAEMKENETEPPTKPVRIIILLEGYAFHENSNEQFRLINNFLGKIKNSADFASQFNNIELITRQETVDNYELTAFRISCN